MSDKTAVPEYRTLNTEELNALEQGLALAASMAGMASELSMQQVQSLYDKALRKKPSDDELIAIGLAFGQQIIAKTGFAWVRISDQWGDETCVGPVGRSLHCAPISMIQKRLDRRDREDLETLAVTLARHMLEDIVVGGVGDW
jgi:hypothetical protein